MGAALWSGAGKVGLLRLWLTELSTFAICLAKSSRAKSQAALQIGSAKRPSGFTIQLMFWFTESDSTVNTNGEILSVEHPAKGKLVQFKSDLQSGTGIVEHVANGNFWLRGISVRSKWGQDLQPGNSIVVRRGEILKILSEV